MLFRNFGRHDRQVSALGLGCMRFPTTTNDPASIDESKSIEMIHYAIANGVNYLDTAYLYHGGASETLVGKALKNGFREKVLVATKMPTWHVNSSKDFYTYLEEQVIKLNIGHIDVYLLHSLDRNKWSKLQALGVLEFLNKARNEGLIKYVGFSFHASLQLFKEIVNAYDWDCCQIQYNYLDVDYQAGIEGLKYAAARKIAVIAMEPLRGGRLVNNVPREIMEIWHQSKVKRSLAEWGLRWVLNHPEISVVLSGMSSIEQVKENIRISSRVLPNSLTDQEVHIISRVKAQYEKIFKVQCTACGYCLPCPVGIDIPLNLEFYNLIELYLYNKRELSYFDFGKQYLEGMVSCTQCGKCETKCPQQLNIRGYLQEVSSIRSLILRL